MQQVQQKISWKGHSRSRHMPWTAEDKNGKPRKIHCWLFFQLFFKSGISTFIID